MPFILFLVLSPRKFDNKLNDSPYIPLYFWLQCIILPHFPINKSLYLYHQVALHIYINHLKYMLVMQIIHCTIINPIKNILLFLTSYPHLILLFCYDCFENQNHVLFLFLIFSSSQKTEYQLFNFNHNIQKTLTSSNENESLHT